MRTKRKNNRDTENQPNMHLKAFLRKRYNIWIIVSSMLVLLGIYIYFLSIRDYIIYPDLKDFYYGFYTDSANNGNSKILNSIISDTLLQFDFDLNEGFINPYVGVNIKSRNNRELNLSLYNQIKIDVKAKGINNLGLSLFTCNQLSEIAGKAKELCFVFNQKISGQRKCYTIDINQLKIPDWYSDVYEIPDYDAIQPDTRKIAYINITTAYTPNLANQCSISIYSVLFTRSNKKILLILSIILVAIFFVLISVYYWKFFWAKKNTIVTISYIPVPLNDNKEEQTADYMAYINNNFQSPNLSLDQVSKNTGTSQRFIANTIHEIYGCNFKTYVNQIRINDSKRMLKESALNISEIGFKVGFNSQSHFARVFKSLTGTSPTTYREKHQQ